MDDGADLMFQRVVREHAAGKRDLCTKKYLRTGNRLNGKPFGKEKAEAALDVLVHDQRLQLAIVRRLEGKGGKERMQEREIYEPVPA